MCTVWESNLDREMNGEPVVVDGKIDALLLNNRESSRRVYEVAR